MEVKTTEEVTRIYCDVCSRNITGGNRMTFEAGVDKPGQDWVVCDGGKYIVKEGRRDLAGKVEPSVWLSCADIAVLKSKYPELLTSGQQLV